MMHRKIFCIVFVAVFMVPAFVSGRQGRDKQNREFHRQQQQERMEYQYQQRQENLNLRKTLPEMTPEERQEAIRQHRDIQYQENRAFKEKMHEENMAFLKERLSHNKRLTEQQKEELIHFYEQQHDENINFRDQQHKENVDLFEKIANDPDMTYEEKKAAVSPMSNNKGKKIGNTGVFRSRKDRI